MHLLGRWWNGQWGNARRDIWLTGDGKSWHVRGRHGGADGPEVQYEYDQEWAARAMVDQLINAAPVGRWKDITRLVTKPAASPDR
jgi:hypothetical protein